MLIGHINGANLILGKPADWDEAKDGKCSSLPVRRQETEGGGSVLVSAWQPTPAELLRLAQGEPVYLWIWSDAHPPVMLTVGEP